MVDALFVAPDGPYPTLLGAEHCWDEARDARTYDGPGPVVAHPPCRLWVNLAAVNWERYGRQLPAWYAGGDDGGCFSAALEAVNRCGGVLEHPADTHAWVRHGLCPPTCIGWQPCLDGSWVCEVWQSAYGHRARKRTWLLYRGERHPIGLRWDAKPGTHVIGGGIHSGQAAGRPKMNTKEACASPVAFARELIRLARESRA
jgi:hypothetical protein